MTTTDLKINGMTCQHCALSVTEELQELPGVAGVDVTVVAGGTSTATVTLDGGPVPSAEDFRAAVEEAGYALA
jgi:copper chaperone